MPYQIFKLYCSKVQIQIKLPCESSYIFCLVFNVQAKQTAMWNPMNYEKPFNSNP